jgi:hypothetical protein
MPTERARILELALENLIGQRKQIESEIAEISGELEGGRAKKTSAVGPGAPVPGKRRAARRRSRFSKQERERRSARMKAYWENWRKEKKQKAKK